MKYRVMKKAIYALYVLNSVLNIEIKEPSVQQRQG